MWEILKNYPLDDNYFTDDKTTYEMRFSKATYINIMMNEDSKAYIPKKKFSSRHSYLKKLFQV